MSYPCTNKSLIFVNTVAVYAEFSHHEFSRRVQQKVKDELNDFGCEVTISGFPLPSNESNIMTRTRVQTLQSAIKLHLLSFSLEMLQFSKPSLYSRPLPQHLFFSECSLKSPKQTTFTSTKRLSDNDWISFTRVLHESESKMLLGFLLR